MRQSALPAPDPALVDRLVEAAAAAHGHLCAGQVIGVRMSLYGLGLLGFGCPLGLPEIKQVVGFVEIDRCMADAVAIATGLRFGRGSLKFINQGLLAATFLDLASGRAVRLISREQARQLAADYAPSGTPLQSQQERAYRLMPDSELFDVEWVRVELADHQLPGARVPKVPCQQCGILVRGGHIRQRQGRRLCAVCAGESYFTHLEDS